MTELDTQLKWFPVWTNIYYFVFAIISFYIIHSRHTKFNTLTYIIIVLLLLEGGISTAHHLTSEEFKQTKDIPTYSKILGILDQIGANLLFMSCLLLMLYTYVQVKKKTVVHTLLFVLYITTCLFAGTCYLIDLYFEQKEYPDNENYKLYDIFHGEWHTLTAYAYVICFIFIVYNLDQVTD